MEWLNPGTVHQRMVTSWEIHQRMVIMGSFINGVVKSWDCSSTDGYIM